MKIGVTNPGKGINQNHLKPVYGIPINFVTISGLGLDHIRIPIRMLIISILHSYKSSYLENC